MPVDFGELWVRLLVKRKLMTGALVQYELLLGAAGAGQTPVWAALGNCHRARQALGICIGRVCRAG